MGAKAPPGDNLAEASSGLMVSPQSLEPDPQHSPSVSPTLLVFPPTWPGGREALSEQGQTASPAGSTRGQGSGGMRPTCQACPASPTISDNCHPALSLGCPWWWWGHLGKGDPIPTSTLLLLPASPGLIPHPGCPLGPTKKVSWTTTLLWDSQHARAKCKHVCACMYACVRA